MCGGELSCTRRAFLKKKKKADCSFQQCLGLRRGGNINIAQEDEGSLRKALASGNVCIDEPLSILVAPLAACVESMPYVQVEANRFLYVRKGRDCSGLFGIIEWPILRP